MTKFALIVGTVMCLLSGQAEAQLNPENFVEFKIRKRAQSGKSSKVSKSGYSSLHYIQPQSQVQIHFNQKAIDPIKDQVRVKIVASLIRANAEEIPLEVFGYSEVVTDNSPQKDNDNDIQKLAINYEVKYYEINGSDLSDTEVDVASLALDEGDRIRVVVYNVKDDPKIGYSMVFEIEDFGWTSGPSGGFSFLKTTENNNINFKPSPNIGWSFYYKPHKGRTIAELLFTPSIGPELTVVDFNDQTTFGIGFQISEFANTVKFGTGFLANYEESGRAYFTIGFNFIDGVNTIKALREEN